MDPTTLSLLLGGTAMAAGGGFLGARDAEKNAEARTKARNDVLSRSLARQKGYGDETRGIFDATMTGWAPEAQATGLTAAQDARTAVATGNITDPTGEDFAVSKSAPGAVKGAIAKRMLETFTDATERAKAAGRYGGYGDQWTGNALGVSDAGRRIATVNDFSKQESALLSSEQDLAEAGATKKPSLWGPILQAGGTALAGIGGRMGGGGVGAPSAVNYGDGVMRPMFG